MATVAESSNQTTNKVMKEKKNPESAVLKGRGRAMVSRPCVGAAVAFVEWFLLC
jgi:hypothetical protein